MECLNQTRPKQPLKKFKLNTLASQSAEQLFGHENKKFNFYNFLQVFDGSRSHLMKFQALAKKSHIKFNLNNCGVIKWHVLVTASQFKISIPRHFNIKMTPKQSNYFIFIFLNQNSFEKYTFQSVDFLLYKTNRFWMQKIQVFEVLMKIPGRDGELLKTLKYS